MKRALPILVLTVAALVPLWRFEPAASTTVASSSPPSAESSSDGAGEVVAGSNVSTRYGNVQVEVTFSGGQITSVTMLQQPDSGPTSRAVPELIEETLTAQSADVDSVSGATTTSAAYVESLQSAIDSRES
jgi:uncharacterized protein with FMN-binding domain